MVQVYQTIRFGAADTPACPVCKGTMYLTKRMPHASWGDGFERQTFECRSCHHDTQRTADRVGEFLGKKPPTLWPFDFKILDRALKAIEDELPEVI
jgi:hypothetical protein